VLYFEARDDAEAQAEARRLMLSSFSAFRLTSDLLVNSKGAAKKIILFLGCKHAAEALQAAAEQLRECVEAASLCALDGLAGEALAAKSNAASLAPHNAAAQKHTARHWRGGGPLLVQGRLRRHRRH